MSDDLTTSLVEFKCRVADQNTAPSPVKDFELFLAAQKKPFAVEEFIVKKADLTNDADWVAWFAEQSGENEAFVAIFLVHHEDKAHFDGRWQEWLSQKEKELGRISEPTIDAMTDHSRFPS